MRIKPVKGTTKRPTGPKRGNKKLPRKKISAQDFANFILHSGKKEVYNGKIPLSVQLAIKELVEARKEEMSEKKFLTFGSTLTLAQSGTGTYYLSQHGSGEILRFLGVMFLFLAARNVPRVARIQRALMAKRGKLREATTKLESALRDAREPELKKFIEMNPLILASNDRKLVGVSYDQIAGLFGWKRVKPNK